MAEQKDQLKHEIVTELQAERTRWIRNAMALAGLALVVGCTVALNPLVGGIVAGAFMLVIGIAGMVMGRKRTEEAKADD